MRIFSQLLRSVDYFISRFAKKKAPLFSLIANPPKAKNDDKVTFLERISEKYLVTFGNFCNFAADFNTHVYA